MQGWVDYEVWGDAPGAEEVRTRSETESERSQANRRSSIQNGVALECRLQFCAAIRIDAFQVFVLELVMHIATRVSRALFEGLNRSRTRWIVQVNSIAFIQTLCARLRIG